jgi:hypothetical protein
MQLAQHCFLIKPPAHYLEGTKAVEFTVYSSPLKMASSPLAPQVSEVELALLVKEYLRTRSDKYKKAYLEFEKESKALLRNIGSHGKIKSLREIVNGYFELRSLEQGKQQFISQHATMLEPLLLGTLKKLASLLEDYRLARGQTAMNFEANFARDAGSNRGNSGRLGGGNHPSSTHNKRYRPTSQSRPGGPSTSASGRLPRDHEAALRSAREAIGIPSAPQANPPFDHAQSGASGMPNVQSSPTGETSEVIREQPNVSSPPSSGTHRRKKKRAVQWGGRFSPAKRKTPQQPEIMNRPVNENMIQQISTNRDMASLIANEVNNHIGGGENSLLPFDANLSGGVTNTGVIVGALGNNENFMSHLQKSQNEQHVDAAHSGDIDYHAVANRVADLHDKEGDRV